MSNLNQWLIDNQYGDITSLHPLSGGCINQVNKISTESGDVFCLKQNDTAPDDFFISEAENLRALANTKSIKVPKVFYVDDHCLLLEFIECHRRQHFWQKLGQQLATCHNQAQQCFGFTSNNYCGETQQLNPITNDGYDFFTEYRLNIQAKWARDKGLLGSAHIRQIEKLSHNLENLIPAQRPALLHGDLWSGNIHCDTDGNPVLIDPACYWGWPEADLAMTSLFGGFNDEFYNSYIENRQLERGWRDRFPLYNLYHLLNHLNLFGSSYLHQVVSVLHRYN